MTDERQSPVRILQITDPHLFADASGELRGTVTADSLNTVVDHVLAEAWPADFVASTGDLVQDNSAGAYDRFKSIMQRLNLPIHCVPGNHDVRSLMQAALSGDPWHYCEAFDIGDWFVIGIDSCNEGDAGGVVNDSELNRLSTALSQTTAPNAIVFLHHPPLPMGSKWLDSVGLRNAREFLETIGRHEKVRAAVFGHVHQAFDETYGSTRIIGTPSSCAQFKPRVEKFELDDTPPAYRRIELGGDGSIETELIWMETDQ